MQNALFVFGYIRHSIISILVFSLFFSFFQANAQTSVLSGTVQNLPDTLNRKEIRVDPSSAALEVVAAELLDSVVYVPLETMKKSIFSGIDQMEVTAKYYIILDESSNSILLFTRDGKFYSKILNTDKSAEITYKKIGKFIVDEKKEEISFFDPHSFFRYYYSFEGKYLKRTEKVISSEDFWPLPIGLNVYLRNTNQMLYRSNKDFFESNIIAETNSILIVDSTKRIKSAYLPVDTSALALDDLYGISQTFYNHHTGKIVLSIPYDYSIYEIDNMGKMASIYRFVLPAINSLPTDFMKNKVYKANRIGYLNRNKNAVYSIADFYLVGKFVSFRLVNGIDLHNYLLYNLETGELISMNEITSDQTCFKLPILQDRIYASENKNVLISSLSASTLFTAREKLRKDKNWEKQLPQSMKKLYKGDQLQNPVLTLLYIKK